MGKQLQSAKSLEEIYPRISVRISQAEIERLKREAASNNRGFSDYVRIRLGCTRPAPRK